MQRTFKLGVLWLVIILAGCDAELGASLNGFGDDAGSMERGRGVGSYRVGKADVAGSDVSPDDAPWEYKLSYDVLTLVPDGHTLLIGLPVPGPGQGWQTPGLELAAHDLDSGETQLLGLRDVERVNFSHDGKTGWLIAPGPGGGTVLWRMDVATLKVSQHAKLPERFRTLDITPDDARVVLSNVPRDAQSWFNSAGCMQEVTRGGTEVPVDTCRYTLIGAASPTVDDFTAPYPIRDLDFLPSGELLLTWSHWAGDDAVATMRFQQPGGVGLAASVTEISMPNCADEVVLAPAHGLALLAPSSCAKDPISVVDFVQRKFIKNLPGFGPVSVLGDQALGFTLKADMVSQWQYAQAKDVGLIRVDLETLSWTVLELGKVAPAYTPTPDGKHLLLWDGHVGAWQDYLAAPGNLRRVAIEDGSIAPFDNWTVLPRQFTWLPDGQALTVSGGMLFRVQPAETKIVPVPIDGLRADLLRVRGQEALLGEARRPQLHRLDLVQGKVKTKDLGLGAQMALPPLPAEMPHGWSALAIRDGAALELPACSTATAGTRIANVTLERLVDGKWLESKWTSYSVAVACPSDPAQVKAPVDVLARTVLARPFFLQNGGFIPDLLPGDRLRVERAADAPGSGPCLDGQACALRPLVLSLVPHGYVAPVAPVPWVLGTFAGKASFEVEVPAP